MEKDWFENSKIEPLGISYMTKCVNSIPGLRAFFSENDKTPVYDGSIIDRNNMKVDVQLKCSINNTAHKIESKYLNSTASGPILYMLCYNLNTSPKIIYTYLTQEIIEELDFSKPVYLKIPERSNKESTQVLVTKEFRTNGFKNDFYRNATFSMSPKQINLEYVKANDIKETDLKLIFNNFTTQRAMTYKPEYVLNTKGKFLKFDNIKQVKKIWTPKVIEIINGIEYENKLFVDNIALENEELNIINEIGGTKIQIYTSNYELNVNVHSIDVNTADSVIKWMVELLQEIGIITLLEGHNYTECFHFLTLNEVISGIDEFMIIFNFFEDTFILYFDGEKYITINKNTKIDNGYIMEEKIINDKNIASWNSFEERYPNLCRLLKETDELCAYF